MHTLLHRTPAYRLGCCTINSVEWQIGQANLNSVWAGSDAYVPATVSTAAARATALLQRLQHSVWVKVALDTMGLAALLRAAGWFVPNRLLLSQRAQPVQLAHG